MYTWGYIVDLTLAKLDLTQEEALNMQILEKLYMYANEAMTQICSTVKPCRDFYVVNIYKNVEVVDNGLIIDDVKYEDLVLKDNGDVVNSNDEVVFYKLGSIISIDDPLFIAFGDDISTLETVDDWGDRFVEEAHNDVLIRKGYNNFKCYEPGTYSVSYNKRWFRFLPSLSPSTVINAPVDVLECLPSYMASQVYRMEDDYKSSVLRNEYEMFIARIDDTRYNTTSTIKIQGDW